MLFLIDVVGLLVVEKEEKGSADIAPPLHNFQLEVDGGRQDLRRFCFYISIDWFLKFRGFDWAVRVIGIVGTRFKVL